MSGAVEGWPAINLEQGGLTDLPARLGIMQAVSAKGSRHSVLIRRLNSPCRRSMALVVRIERHWLVRGTLRS